MSSVLDFDVPSDAEDYEEPTATQAREGPRPVEEIEEAPPQEEVRAEAPEPEEEPEEPPPQQSRAQQRIQQEISRRKDLEQKMALMEQRFAMLQDRMGNLQQPAQQQAKEPELPSYDEDPGAHLLRRQEQLERAIAQQTEMSSAQQQQQEAQRQWAAFAQNFQSDEANYAQTSAPDYYEAINWLRDQRTRQYQALGYSQQEATQIVNHEAQTQAVEMARRGRNGADGFYSLAKAAGWRGSANPVADVHRLQENVSRSTSLGSRGKSGREPTLAEIAEMSEADFEAATSGDKWRKLMGG